MDNEHQQRSFPDRLLLVLAAGGVAEIVLETIAWWIAPTILGKPMRPDILVSDIARAIFHTDISVQFAVSIHLALGLLIFPLGYLLARKMTRVESVWNLAIAYGVFLWLVAQSVLAPMAGRPFMLGFVGYTWMSLIVHIVYSVVLAYALYSLERVDSNRSTN